MPDFRIAIAALAVTVLASGAEARSLTFRGICNASAAIAIDEKTIIVGDDEQPWLSVYDLGSQALSKPTIRLPFGPQGAGGDPDDAPEADIEAATVLDGRIVWSSSFGRNKKGKVRPERFQLFASHSIDQQAGTMAGAFSASYHDLLPLILESRKTDFKPLARAIGDLSQADKRLAPKAKGFNIEGLTTTRDGKNLLVGLRNPLTWDGQAILFELDGLDSLLGGGAASPTLGAVTTIDLGGRGIRDIAWSPAHDAYLIAAGQTNDKKSGPGFALYKWDGRGSPVRFRDFDDAMEKAEDFHPEAVVPLLERSSAGGLAPSKRVLVLSDDGKRTMPDRQVCEDEPSFRGLVETVP